MERQVRCSWSRAESLSPTTKVWSLTDKTVYVVGGTILAAITVAAGTDQLIDTGFTVPVADPVGMQFIVMTTEHTGSPGTIVVDDVVIHIDSLIVNTETVESSLQISIEPALVTRTARMDFSLDPPPRGTFSYQEHAVNPPDNDTSPLRDPETVACNLNMLIGES